MIITFFRFFSIRFFLSDNPRGSFIQVTQVFSNVVFFFFILFYLDNYYFFQFFFYGVESQNFFFHSKKFNNNTWTLFLYTSEKISCCGPSTRASSFQQCNEKTSKDDNSKPFGFSFLFFWEFYGTETNRYSQALHILNEEDLASDFCEILCSQKEEKKNQFGFFFSVKSKFWLVYVLLYTRIDLSFVQKLKVEFIKVNHIFLKKIELKVKNN